MPVVAWMVLIVAGSTDALSAEHTSRFLVPFLRWLDPQISAATIATMHFLLRKVGHLTEYGILAALLWRALSGTFTSKKGSSVAAIALGTAALFAASDEFHQSFIPTRTAAPEDVLIDIFGAILGIALCFFFAQRNVARGLGGPERI